MVLYVVGFRKWLYSAALGACHIVSCAVYRVWRIHGPITMVTSEFIWLFAEELCTCYPVGFDHYVSKSFVICMCGCMCGHASSGHSYHVNHFCIISASFLLDSPLLCLFYHRHARWLVLIQQLTLLHSNNEETCMMLYLMQTSLCCLPKDTFNFCILQNLTCLFSQ